MKFLKSMADYDIAYGRFVLPLLVSCLLVSVYELSSLFLIHSKDVFEPSLIGWTLWSVLIFSCQLSALLSIPFILIRLLSKTAGRWIFGSLLVLFFVLGLIFVEYFLTSFLLLDFGVLRMSLDEILHVMESENDKISFWRISWVIFSLALAFLYFRWLKRKGRPAMGSWPFVVFGVLIWIQAGAFRLPKVHFQEEVKQEIITHKLSYFLNTIQKELIEKEEILPNEFESGVKTWAQYQDRPLGSLKYPFYRKTKDGSSLAPFFNTPSQKVNLVIVCLEGFGKSVSGPFASYGSFTPYLDSLAKEGIELGNLYSGGNRTFGILPNLLGSLPEGENQPFMHGADKMPKFQTIADFLPDHDKRFYYAGWMGFDRMNGFLDRAGFSYTQIYDSLPKLGNWGASDEDLMKYYASELNLNSKPKLDVLLTLTNHSPFLLPEGFPKDSIFQERLNVLGIDSSQLEIYENYKSGLSTTLYADLQIKKLIEEWKKRPDFENTIFLFTGDHHLIGLPNIKFEEHAVRGVIYSPLIKEPKTFLGVNTHRDLGLALLRLLDEWGQAEFPEKASFLGNDIDTSQAFRARNQGSIVNENGVLVGFMKDRYVYLMGSLYRLRQDGSFSLDANPILLESLKKEMEALDLVYQYVNRQNRLLPEEVY